MRQQEVRPALLALALAARQTTALIVEGSGWARTRRRAGGGQRCARTGAIGQIWQLAAARAGGGQQDKQQERAGGGGGRSDNVGSNVLVRGGAVAADNAIQAGGG